MTTQQKETIIMFLNQPENKQLRALIEIAATGNEEAVNYIEFISAEIKRKFDAVSGESDALSPMRLMVKIDAAKGQSTIRNVNPKIGYYFNTYGKLVTSISAVTPTPKDPKHPRTSININFKEFALLQQSITNFVFFQLINSLKFRYKCVGKKVTKSKKKSAVPKKGQPIEIDAKFEYKTILFSPKFEQCNNIVVILPPQRAGISYMTLCIDEGLSYGTMLPYVEKILAMNPKRKKKKSLAPKNTNTNSNSADAKENKEDVVKPKKPLHRWGVMLVDPLGKDENNNKYSVIKIFDKWLSKRIPALNIFGLPVKSSGGKRRDSDELSVSSMISVASGSKNMKAEITNLFFIGGLENGELVSHLLHRRGQELEKVVRGICMLECQDPYDANDVTRSIYKKCARNWMNSNLKLDAPIEGTKINGDPYIIERVSSGNARYCCTSACDSVIKFIVDRVDVDYDEAECIQEIQEQT